MRKSDRHFASAIDTFKRPSHTLRKDVVAEITNRRKLSNAALGGSRPTHAAPSGPAQEFMVASVSARTLPRQGRAPPGATQHTQHSRRSARAALSSIKRAVERDIPQTPLWDIGD